MKKLARKDCFDKAVEASEGVLTKAEVIQAFDDVMGMQEKLQEKGDIDGIGDRLKSAAERKADQVRIAAALQRRHAALNILARKRLDEKLASFEASGIAPNKAILAVMEGTQQGVVGGRNSASALRLAYESRYIGDLFARVERERPHLKALMRDEKFDADLTREMFELREGGEPGSTKNTDAQYMARVFAEHSEMTRQELNKLGASIGKLDGWTGSQVHDDVKLIGAGKDGWVDAILPRLDLDRMFPNGETREEIMEVLGGIYDTIITGTPNTITPKQKGQRVNPANLAKSLGKSRVIHFKDADNALEYRSEFGYGNTVSGMFGHFRKTAQIAAQMETFGPNPEIMFGALVEKQKKNVKASKRSPAEKARLTKKLETQAGTLRDAFDAGSGLATRPVNATAAKIGSDIRAVESMSKLGGAVFAAIPTDTVTAAASAMFRGGSFTKGVIGQLDGVFRGRPKGEQAEIAFALGEGFDALIGHIVAPAAAQDGPVGKLSKLQETFFRYNGLSWWTDVSRSVVARTVAAEMGMRSNTAWGALPANYRHVLGLNDITEELWDVMRKGAFTAENGKRYVTPDRLKHLEGIDDKLKRDAEFALRRFVADETTYGVVEVDDQSARYLRLGTRPGTFAGEAVRFIMQFKGFPIAFINRVGGRALFGSSGATKGERFMNGLPHLGSLVAGLTIAGYMAMTLKDAAKGYWPPRDLTDIKTIMAAMQQGGALGIYGDFLFGEANRFGNSALETIAGPAIGDASSLINALQKARQGDVRGGEWLNVALGSTPFINLFYTRPALDYLFLNSLREASSPGYTKRKAKRRQKDYGQTNIFPTR